MIMQIDVFDSQETTKNLLDTSKEFWDAQISKFEKEITGKNNNQNKENLDRITDSQHARNRKIIMEIIETCQTFKNEIKETFDKMREDEMD